MITRRNLLKALLATIASAAGGAGYAFGVEPILRVRVARHAIQPPLWPRGQRLRVVALADPHLGEPTMSLARLEAIVDQANLLDGDLVVLLGDYTASHPFQTRRIPIRDTARVLSGLRAPLGVRAIIGNHDWWDDVAAQKSRRGPTETHEALAQAGIEVMENDAVRLSTPEGPFWLLGLGDQIAFKPRGPAGWLGVDDLPATLAQVGDEAPAILLAHEPDIFPKVPDRIALTLSGHTHGGQVRLFGWSPVVPSEFGGRFAYGHVREGRRDIVISGGLGCSILPVRLGMPPEITVIELS